MERLNFLNPTAGPTGLDACRAVILPAPFERSTSYGHGAALGPAAIIEASQQVEEYDPLLGIETTAFGIHTAAAVDDDPALPAEKYLERLEQAVESYLERGKLVATLGGEHSLSLAPWRAHQRRHPGAGILQLDAHADLRDSYEGDPYSHASVMRRILETGPAAAVAVGIRSLCREEAELYAAGRVLLLDARTVAMSADWIERAVAALPGEVYLTIDVDALDPAVAPSTGTPEPGGLSWYQMLALLDAVTARKRVIGFDLVELAPNTGVQYPDFTCAKLVYHLIGLVLTRTPAAGRA
ncbi:agmatinase [bacterium]|nr:agmatinase [bacterium]